MQAQYRLRLKAESETAQVARGGILDGSGQAAPLVMVEQALSEVFRREASGRPG